MAIGSTAHAEESYEWLRMQSVLSQDGLELAEAPEGKRIAYVRIVRDDVFVEDEIWPTWFNIFHWMTGDEIVRRELLFAPGGVYQDGRIEESMRNLRGMGIFALVRIVAVQTGNPDEVGVLVHTRDVWSLRLEQDFNITSRTDEDGSQSLQINYLLLRLTERNLFGRNKQVGTDFTLLQKTYTVGGFYYARRVLGSPYSTTQKGGVIYNRASGQPEGYTLSSAFGMPLYSLGQRFGFSTALAYTRQIVRQLQQGEVATYQPDPAIAPAQRVFRQVSRSLWLGAQHRRGESVKHNFEVGLGLSDLDAYPIDETRLDPALREPFASDVLPRLRTQIAPYFGYDFFVPTYQTFTDLGTYGLSENVRVGPSLSFSTSAPLQAFGSTTDSVLAGLSAGLLLTPGGGIVEGRAGVSGRYEEGDLVDRLFSAMMRGATPQFSIFRLVARVGLDARQRDTSRSFVSLGGSNGLRGYQAQTFVGYGDSVLIGNVELRTKPVAWQAVHVGGVLFYDVGSVYERWAELRPHYAVGVGVRLLFPQFNRYPFSFDAAMALDEPSFRLLPTIQAGQVVPMTAIEDALQ